MSAHSNNLGSAASTAINVTYTFEHSVDTVTLYNGFFDIRQWLFSINEISSLDSALRLTVIIPPGITLSSSDPSRPVITFTGFSARDIITVINNGNINGAGGLGGAGGYKAKGSAGQRGGPALVFSGPGSFDLSNSNTGRIMGGGGGDGGQGGLDARVFGWVASGGRYTRCGGKRGGVDYVVGSQCCVRQGCGGCRTDTCGWLECCWIDNCCSCWADPSVNYAGFRCPPVYQQTAYVHVRTDYYTGSTGAVGGVGTAINGQTGKTQTYAGELGGPPGYAIQQEVNLEEGSYTLVNNGKITGG